MGSGVCIVYAPATFAHDDETKAVVDDPTGDPAADIRTAVEACPTGALDSVSERRRSVRRQCCCEGKVAVITGAGSGVGRASALRFAEEGASWSAPTSTWTGPRRPCAQVEAAGGRPWPNDVTCPRRPTWPSAVARRVGRFGRLDIMFNNVGIPTPRLGHELRGPHARGLRAADGGQLPRRVPRLPSTRSSSSRSRATEGSS